MYLALISAMPAISFALLTIDRVFITIPPRFQPCITDGISESHGLKRGRSTSIYPHARRISDRRDLLKRKIGWSLFPACFHTN